MPYIWKVLWSRRRRKKQNKLLFIKYQSYHRHHLIRISSCHTLQRAKKTKKRNSPQKSNRKDQPSRFIHLSHRRSEFKLNMSHCNIHSILLESGAPSHKNCSMWKNGQCRTRFWSARNHYFYLTEERRRTYTSPTSMLLVILFYKVPAVFNIFVVKYNPVSQSTKLTCSILDDVDWPAAYFGRSYTQLKGKLLYSIR